MQPLRRLGCRGQRAIERALDGGEARAGPKPGK
jgi:hypothetical protein